MKEGKVSPEAKVGILVLAGIILLFFMSFRVSKLEKVTGEVYTAHFPSVAGLVVNADVQVAGVPVGKVVKIGLEGERAKVWMKIGQVAIHQDAEAIIKTRGVLGDKYIEIKPGSSEASVLPPGGTIVYVRSAPDIDQLFTSLESAALGMGSLGSSLREILGEEKEKKALKDLFINLRDASANLKEITAQVKTGKGSLGKLLTDDALYNDAKEAVASFRRVMAKVESGEGSLGKLMTDKTFYQEAEKTMKKMQKAAEGVQEQTPITTLGALLGLFF